MMIGEARVSLPRSFATVTQPGYGNGVTDGERKITILRGFTQAEIRLLTGS